MSFQRRASVVAFIGPVGVGKSTQMRLAKDYLRTKGVRTVTTFIKSSHALTLLIERPLIALGAYEEVSYEGNIRVYLRRSIFKRLFRLWCFLDTVNIAVKFFITVYVPMKMGLTVLVEEGLAMTFLTYNRIFPYFFETRPPRLRTLGSLLSWTKTRNHVNIVLDAADDELVHRRTSRNYRQNELPEYVGMQKKWISSLDTEDTVFINTSGQSISAVHQKIVQVLQKIVLRGETYS